MEERIARVILLPGQGAEDAELAQRLDTISNHAEYLVGPWETMQLLKSILAYPGCAVRSSACLVLAQKYPGQDSCLTRVRDDSCIGSLGRGSLFLAPDIVEWRAEADTRARKLAEEINRDAIPDYGPRFSRERMREEHLRIFAMHPDERVSSAARRALARTRRPD
ncbi:MAG: hypothetical protein ABSE56_23165 [Bryobacteraceae bacterium]